MELESQMKFYIVYCTCLFICTCSWKRSGSSGSDARLRQVIQRLKLKLSINGSGSSSGLGLGLSAIVDILTIYCDNSDNANNNKNVLIAFIKYTQEQQTLHPESISSTSTTSINANINPVSESVICMTHHLRVYQYLHISMMYHAISLVEVASMVQLPVEQTQKGRSVYI